MIGKPPPKKPCFLAGTLVSTPTGSIAIEDVKMGDTVYCYDTVNQKLATAQVAKAYTNHATKYAQLTTDSGTVLKVTGQHLFYQKTSDTWIKAHQLKVGMKLYLPHTDSFELITHKQVIEENTATYNFEVPEHHNYLVGKNGILAHNANPSKAFTSTEKFRILFYKLNLPQFKDAEQSARYIGQTIQETGARLSQHQKEAKKALESGDPKLIKKWGFKAEMIIQPLSNYAEMTPFEAAVWEQYHINNNGGKPTRLNKETLLNNKKNAISEKTFNRIKKNYNFNPCQYF